MTMILLLQICCQKKLFLYILQIQIDTTYIFSFSFSSQPPTKPEFLFKTIRNVTSFHPFACLHTYQSIFCISNHDVPQDVRSTLGVKPQASEIDTDHDPLNIILRVTISSFAVQSRLSSSSIEEDDVFFLTSCIC